jgi:hypothetical protein
MVEEEELDEDEWNRNENKDEEELGEEEFPPDVGLGGPPLAIADEGFALDDSKD